MHQISRNDKGQNNCTPAQYGGIWMLVCIDIQFVVQCLHSVWADVLPEVLVNSQTPLKFSYRHRQAGFCEILKSSWGIPDGLVHVLHYVPLSPDYLPHDDVMQWNHFPCYWPFVRGIHRLPMVSTHKDQWRGALMFSLICAGTNDWANNRNAGDLRRHRVHYDVSVMKPCDDWSNSRWCCNIWPPLETHLKLKSREIAFACNFLLCCQIVLKFCTEHGIVVICANFSELLHNWNRCSGRDFARFEIKGRVSYMATATRPWSSKRPALHKLHYTDVIMSTIASQITSLAVVYSIVYSGPDQRKHQSSASLAFVRGIHRDRWIPRTKGQ